MPNWCNNTATFHNDDVGEVDKLYDYLKKVQEDEKSEQGLFSYFLPIPKEETDNWYDWCVSNWGTKWEASLYGVSREDDNSIIISFDTAWAPPTGFYEYLARHTEFYVNAKYIEEGMGFIGGNDGGEDFYYEYSDLQSLDEIPEDLVEYWNLRERLEEWEEESLTEALHELIEGFDSMQNDEQIEKNAFSDEKGREWLKELLHEQVVGVTFTKKDGTERVMQATLSESFIPQADRSENSTNIRKKSDEALAVWDTEVQGWRSFRWDSIKSVNFSLGE